MPYINLNGRQVFVPDAGLSGEQLITTVNPTKKAGRRTTIIKGPNAEPVNPYKTYKPGDLIDKKGKPVKWGDMPDRTKGGWLTDLIKGIMGDNNPPQQRSHYETQTNRTVQRTTSSDEKKNDNPLFWGSRSTLSKRIVLEQCEDIAKNRFSNQVTIDYDGANTFVVTDYLLPSKWHRVPGVTNGRTSLAIVFPTDYPRIAPIGFYLKAQIADAPNGHFYAQAYHNADKVMLQYGWKWYCVYVNEGQWQPAMYRKANDWRFGDNIWTYFDLIKEVLTSND